MSPPVPEYRWSQFKKRFRAIAKCLDISWTELWWVINDRLHEQDKIEKYTFFSYLKNNKQVNPEVVLAMLEVNLIMEASISREEVVGFTRDIPLALLVKQNQTKKSNE